MTALVESGCDIIEVGMPYSDPGMDGPTIATATEVALRGGVRVRDSLTAVEAISKAGGRAVVMTYWNLVLHYGVDAFARDLASAGGLGMITPDLIPDEAGEWLAVSDVHGLDRIFLVAPSSTPERLAATATASRGFVYAASTMGVTGARDAVSNAAPELVARVKSVSDIPVGVGLGVRSREQAAADRCVRRRCNCWFGPGVGADGGPARRASADRRTGRRCPAEDFGVTTTLLASFPSPSQGVWHLGPIPLRAYALFILVGVIAALFIGNKRWTDRGGEPGVIFDIALWAIIFGLVGGRLYHVLTDWTTYFGPGGAGLVAAFKIQEGGLGIWGAVALGGVGAWIGCRRKGIPLPAFGDAVAPGIVLAQAIGRIGNYFNQELYGRTTSLPWGLEIFERRDANGALDSLNGASTGQLIEIVHPTFLYELLWNLLVFALLIWVDRRYRIGHGRLFALYVAAYCFGRFWIELMRSDMATHIAGIRINSFVSVFVFIGAVVYLMVAPKGREDPSELQGDVAVDEKVDQKTDEKDSPADEVTKKSLDVRPFAISRSPTLGDIPCTPFDIDEAIVQIETGARELLGSSGAFIALGGDHTIALPLLRAVHAAHGPVALVHFDAHLDTWDSYFGAVHARHAVPPRVRGGPVRARPACRTSGSAGRCSRRRTWWTTPGSGSRSWARSTT